MQLDKSLHWYSSFGLPYNDEIVLISGAVPSSTYSLWFLEKEKFMPYLGASKRFYKTKSPPVQNSHCETFVRSHKHLFDPDEYRYAIPTIDSSYKSMSNYAREQPLVCQDSSWILAYQWLLQSYLPYLAGSRVSSWDVVKGNADKATSCGFFWRKLFPTKGMFMTSSICDTVLNEYWTRLSTNDPVQSIRQVSDKYEMRPSAKLDESPPATRTFIVEPIEVVFSTNRLSLHFNDLFYRSSCKTASSVGSSKYLGGYNLYFSKLSGFHQKFSVGYCYDFSKYDMSMFRSLVLVVCQLRWDAMHPDDRTPENHARLFNSYHCMLNCFIWTVLGEFLFKETGNNSGQGNTIVDNTLAQNFLWYLVFIRLYYKGFCFEPKPDFSHERYVDTDSYFNSIEPPSLELFNDCLSLLLCGDDCVMGIDLSITDWFNIETVVREFSLFGMKLTFSFPTPVSISRFEYCSHTFVQLPGSLVWLPCPSTSKIMCSLFKASPSVDIRWILLRAFALRIESWANVTCRNLLNVFILETMAKFREDLCGSLPVPSAPSVVVSWTTILQSYLSDDVLRKLYYGYEGAVDITKFGAFKFIPFRSLSFYVESSDL